MDPNVVVGIIAVVATVLLTIVGSAIAIAVKFGSYSNEVEVLKSDMVSLEERFTKENDMAISNHCKDIEMVMVKIAEDKAHDDKRIQELYESRNETNQNIRDIMKDIQYVAKSMDELKVTIKETLQVGK